MIDYNNYRYMGDYSAVDPAYSCYMQCHHCYVTWIGCWNNFQCPKCGRGGLHNNDINIIPNTFIKKVSLIIKKLE